MRVNIRRAFNIHAQAMLLSFAYFLSPSFLICRYFVDLLFFSYEYTLYTNYQRNAKLFIENYDDVENFK